jgi:acyl-CoA reductase-like NAD-dependent aldehyde dehydrogenase
MDTAHANYVAGGWVSGAATVADVNPSDRTDVVGEFAVADEAQVDVAIGAAAEAAADWAAATPWERFTALEQIGLELAAREEIFGPVATVLRAEDPEHALALANDTEYGLSAGVCTTSLKHAARFRDGLQAGIVTVNLPTAGVDFHVPFGGTKGSSSGAREQGRYAVEFFTTVKTAYVRPV